MPANLVFRRKIWGARDNGLPPRSTPGVPFVSGPHLDLCLQITGCFNEYFKAVNEVSFLIDENLIDECLLDECA